MNLEFSGDISRLNSLCQIMWIYFIELLFIMGIIFLCALIIIMILFVITLIKIKCFKANKDIVLDSWKETWTDLKDSIM